MIGFILAFIVFVSPTLIILLIALSQFGWVWSLLWILAGSIITGLVFAIAGAVLYTLQVQWEDRQTRPPESGAIGAGLGRAIATLIFIVVFGLIGSGCGAFLAFKYFF
jgi:hypothetical protein